uniref:Uncharacterized protein n=1 Tax=Aegilops tauschii TaxID=37682 RepID=M8CB30_AEGTA
MWSSMHSTHQQLSCHDCILVRLERSAVPLPPLAITDEEPAGMSRRKQLRRGDRQLPTDRPAHTRRTRPVDIREVTADAIVMAAEVSFDEVMPNARTERQLRRRRRIQKSGHYGDAVIIYPLTEIETELYD